MSKQIYLFPAAWAMVEDGLVVEGSGAIKAIGYVGAHARNLFGAEIEDGDAAVLRMHDGRWLVALENGENKSSHGFDITGIEGVACDQMASDEDTLKRVKAILQKSDITAALHSLYVGSPARGIGGDPAEVALNAQASCRDRAIAFALLAHRGVERACPPYIGAAIDRPSPVAPPAPPVEILPPPIPRATKEDLLARLGAIPCGSEEDVRALQMLSQMVDKNVALIAPAYQKLAPHMRSRVAEEIAQWPPSSSAMKIVAFAYLVEAIRTIPVSTMPAADHPGNLPAQGDPGRGPGQ